MIVDLSSAGPYLVHLKRWLVRSQLEISVCLKDLTTTNFLRDTGMFLAGSLIAERRHAKRAREASLVSKIGNPSGRENLVMTSAYERATKRTPSAQTRGEEGGRLEVSITGDLRNAIFSWRDLSEKTLICTCYVNEQSGMLI